MHLHYRSYGSGHPLIILHGLLGSLDNWATLAKRLAAQFHVFAFDARNHGRSSHSDVMNYDVMVEDLRAFMREHGIASAHLLGHSMGGKTAMQFAVEHPEYVNRLIVVDIAPKAYGRRHDHIFEALCSLDLKKFSHRKEAEEVLSQKIHEPATVQFLLKNLVREEEGTFKWKMNLPVLKKHYDEISAGLSEGAKFEKPALFVRGGKSSYILDEDRALIKKIFPRSNILTVKNAGHWVHADAPDELEKIVVGFLSAKP
ncbi:MAG: alpha/beta fold hydrolase [Bacteroidota bacterium]